MTSGLAWTSDLHRQTATSGPELKPFNDSDLQAAGLQVRATAPGDISTDPMGSNIGFKGSPSQYLRSGSVILVKGQ